MHNKNQEKEDELIALAIAKSEAEQYDKNIRYIEEEFINPRHLRSPPNTNMNPNLEHREMNQRFNNFFRDCSLFQEVGAADDSISISELEAIINLSNTPSQPQRKRDQRPSRGAQGPTATEEVKHRRPAEEVKHPRQYEEFKHPRQADEARRINENFNTRNHNTNSSSRNNIINAGRDIASNNRKHISNRNQRTNISRQNREKPQSSNILFDEIGNYMFDDEDRQATYEELTHLDDANFDKGNGFKESELKRLQVVTFISKNFINSDQCPICMTDFKSLEKVVKLKCNHLYHESCIKEWLARKKICAVCKKEVKL